MNHRILAAALLLAAPAVVSAKTEAIMAFDESGSESVRYFAREGKHRRALGAGDAGESRLTVDAVPGSPEVTAILMALPGRPVPDKDEVEGRLFAFGDTVNARVRQGSGGRRSIHGKVLGPVAVEASAGCDLAALLEAARKGSQADLSKTDAVLVIAPQDACRHAGAATLGRVAIGGRKVAVAWAFGDNWVVSAAHALEHAMGTRHAAELATETFGWAAGTSAATASVKPARAARAASRKRTARMPAKKAVPNDDLLTLAAAASMLEPAMPGDLRDAPGAMRPASLGWLPKTLATAERRPLDTMARPERMGRSGAKATSLDAASCRDGARNLREAIKGAATRGTPVAALIARRRLAEALKRQQAALGGKDVPEDAEVSLLTTDAETELHVALLKLEDPKLTVKALMADVLPSAERAAQSLEEAARRLSGRRS